MEKDSMAVVFQAGRVGVIWMSSFCRTPKENVQMAYEAVIQVPSVAVIVTESSV